MKPQKRKHPKEKLSLHPRNKHRQRYDLKALTDSLPELGSFVIMNKYNDESIDFSNPVAVKVLNKALLKHFYSVDAWDIPKQYLCPPIPGRADYIHNLADILGHVNSGNIPTGKSVQCLDIGVGANCVYPLIGHKEYGWSFVGSDIDPLSIKVANDIIEANDGLKESIQLRLQEDTNTIFSGIIQPDEKYDITMCNPPFHSSLKEAQESAIKKVSGLKKKSVSKVENNFGGQNHELWCVGGEAKFVSDMIEESKMFAESCFWFSSIISRHENLQHIYKSLRKAEVTEVKTIKMGQGTKISRFVAWTFLNKEQQEEWKKDRWM